MKVVDFRSAIISDVDFIYRCLEGLASHESFDLKLNAEDAEKILFKNQESGVSVDIAEVDHLPVGMAIYSHRFSPYSGGFNLLVIDIFVEPDQRAHGIGKAFFSHFEQICQRQDFKKIEFFVNSENFRAQSFYEALGYVHQTYSQHWGKWIGV